MRLSAEELRKFAEIFVDIYEYGSRVAYNNSHSDLVISRVDESVFDKWRKYLNDTCEEYGDDMDAYDKWFDELHSIEDLDPRKVAHYDLPTEPIEIRLGNEASFMRKLLELARTFIANNKPLCTEQTKVGSAYQFTKQAVYVMVYAYDKTADKAALSKAKSNFVDFFNAAKALGAEFNSLQGSEPNIGIGSSINDHYLLGDPFYERTFAIDDGCDTLYYPRAKKRVTQEYADKFYGSVPEESVTIGVKMAE